MIWGLSIAIDKQCPFLNIPLKEGLEGSPRVSRGRFLMRKGIIFYMSFMNVPFLVMFHDVMHNFCPWEKLLHVHDVVCVAFVCKQFFNKCHTSFDTELSTNYFFGYPLALWYSNMAMQNQ